MGTTLIWPQATTHIITIYNIIPEDEHPHNTCNISAEIIDKNIPWAYFDGSTKQHGCGGGVILHIFENHSYKI